MTTAVQNEYDEYRALRRWLCGNKPRPMGRIWRRKSLQGQPHPGYSERVQGDEEAQTLLPAFYLIERLLLHSAILPYWHRWFLRRWQHHLAHGYVQVTHRVVRRLHSIAEHVYTDDVGVSRK